MLLSKEAYDKIKKRLNHLKTVKRKEIAKAVEEARLQGDLRENAGYHEAKKDQSLNEAKIAELEEQLRHAQVVEKGSILKDSVALGSKVRIRNLGSGEELEYTIVSELEADIFQKKISNLSPVGRSLLGAKKNEVVEVAVPAGNIKYKILDIS